MAPNAHQQQMMHSASVRASSASQQGPNYVLPNRNPVADLCNAALRGASVCAEDQEALRAALFEQRLRNRTGQSSVQRTKPMLVLEAAKPVHKANASQHTPSSSGPPIGIPKQPQPKRLQQPGPCPVYMPVKASATTDKKTKKATATYPDFGNLSIRTRNN